jgi:hypothetical protein
MISKLINKTPSGGKRRYKEGIFPPYDQTWEQQQKFSPRTNPEAAKKTKTHGGVPILLQGDLPDKEKSLFKLEGGTDGTYNDGNKVH